MNQYSFLINLLAAEVVILFCLLAAIVIHRMIVFIRERSARKRRIKLTNYFVSLLESKNRFDLKTYPGGRGWKKIALEVLESFHRRFQGDEWREISKGAVESLLLKAARRWCKSFFWIKRNLAARIFALDPLAEDEERVLKLIDDRKFLVRSSAALAAVGMESYLGVEKILKSMSEEPGYSQFFFRDTLLLGSKKVFQFMLKLAEQKELHQSVLDVLGAKSWEGSIPFLKEDLLSENGESRRLAFLVLARNPLTDSLSYFRKGVVDPNSKVRVAAFSGLNLFPIEETGKMLEKGLSDSVWDVRVEAGKVLKSMGNKGIEILKQQQTGIAKEAAEYALQFG